MWSVLAKHFKTTFNQFKVAKAQGTLRCQCCQRHAWCTPKHKVRKAPSLGTSSDPRRGPSLCSGSKRHAFCTLSGNFPLPPFIQTQGTGMYSAAAAPHPRSPLPPTLPLLLVQPAASAILLPTRSCCQCRSSYCCSFPVHQKQKFCSSEWYILY